MKLENFSEEAQKQWKQNKADDYRYRIQCCYNCRHWQKDYTLIGDYAYNACLNMYGVSEGEWKCPKFDFWCPNYFGFMDEHNLIYRESWEMYNNKNN